MQVKSGIRPDPIDAAVLRSRGRLAQRVGMGIAIRRAAGLSQAEVAEAIGVAPSTISRAEAGLTTLRGDAALRYGQLLERLAPMPPEGA